MASKEVYKKTTRQHSDVAQEHRFWVRDGQILKNLRELPRALDRMNNEAFVHHVNKEKNDFANWIEHVIKDKKLADEIRPMRNKAAIRKVIQRVL